MSGEWKAVEDASLLKEGDRIRWTVEARVLVPAEGAFDVHVVFDGGRGTSLPPATLNAGKLERQERPLGVGDEARFRAGGRQPWEIVATHDDYALLKNGSDYTSSSLHDLERVEQ